MLGWRVAGEGGFTLVELLVTMSVLGIVMSGIAGALAAQLAHAVQALGGARPVALADLEIRALHPGAGEKRGYRRARAHALGRGVDPSGVSESVGAALKAARQDSRMRARPCRSTLISHDTPCPGTSMCARPLPWVAALRTPFAPLMPGAVKVPNTNFYRAPGFVADDINAFGLWAADEIERAIEREGEDSVAAVFLEPCQNSGGCFPPPPGYFQRVREICDKHGVLLVSDEVICAFGRLGHYFGSARYGYQPDIITVAKGLTSGYSPLGAMIASERLIEPFLTGDSSFMHGFTFAGHPVSCAVAMANLDVFEREDILGHVRKTRDYFRSSLETLYDLPIVGDVRGEGFFYGIELVKDKATKESFDDEESERLLRGFLSAALFAAGLICRADTRGDPVLQLSPPLISDKTEIDLITEILRGVLADAHARM